MTFDVSKAIENDKETETPKGSLERAIAMGNLLAEADKEVTRLTDELKEAKKTFNGIAMDKLPALLKELKLSSIELETGEKIEVKGDLNASITKANHELAMKWLIDNHFSGIIKSNVTIEFNAEDHETAAKLTSELQEEHDGVIFKAAVHPATLKSFVKEQLAAGTALPLDLFSVHEYSIAKLTQSKRSK